MKNSIQNSVMETAKGLHKAGIMNKTTMRELESLYIPEVVDYSPEKIKNIRIKLNYSQAVFAKILNVSKSAIQQWECGVKHPDGPALKLLNLIDNKGVSSLL